MYELDWTVLLDFIRAADPALATSFRGVSERAIQTCEARYGIRFPSSYVGFLTIMGEDSGVLYPFGRAYVHTFSEIVEQLPPEEHPGRRFFMIAFDTDPMPIAILQTFLDLARSDGTDAPVTEFETGEHAPAIVNDWDFTLGEMLTRRIFGALELDRRAYQGTVVVKSRDARHAQDIKKASLELLGGLGFQSVLPELNRVGCMRRNSTSLFVLVDDKTHFVDLQFGADDELEGLDAVLNSVLAGIPTADLIEPPRKRV